MLAAWKRTTEPLATFARENGLGANRLYWWKKRLGGEQAPSMLELVPARVTGGEEVSVVVRIANNVSIEIAKASPRLIAELIGELTRAGA